MTNVLIDTNVFIYALNADSEYHDKCVRLLYGEEQLFTTSKNISEYFAVCSKLNIDSHLIWTFYNSLLTNVTLLYPNEISMKIFEELILKYKPSGNRVFDIEIVSIMLSSGLAEIATLNHKDFLLVTEINLFRF